MIREAIRVLHVDDEPEFADLTATLLEREDDRFVVETATSAEEGLEVIEDRPPDCVVSDYNMPGTDGIEFLKTIREQSPDLPFVLFTGKGGETVASDAISAGVTDYLQKGSGTEQYELLANRIQNLVTARRDAKEATRQRDLMRRAEVLGATGGWELRVESKELRLTDGIKQIYDVETDRDLSLEEVLGLYQPNSQREIQSIIDDAMEDGYAEIDDLRLQTATGEKRVVEGNAELVENDGDSTILRGVIRDITDQKQREEELESERRFIDQALDTLDDLFYVLNQDGSLKRWNDRVPEVTGYSESEVAEMDATEFFAQDQQETVADAITAVASDEEVTVEADLRTADGDRIPYEFTGKRLTDGDGNTTGLVGVGRDLTERRQRERQFRALVEGSNDVISIIDEDGQFRYQSHSVERILGYDHEETVGDVAWEYIHSDDRERVMDTFEAWLTAPDESTEPVQYRARHADGSWRWMEARGNDQLDNQAVEGIVVTSRDITDRRERERELREVKSQYQLLVENFPDGAVFLYDTDCRYIRAGGEELSDVGLSPDQFEGATPSELFPDGIAAETVEYYRAALSGKSHTFEQEYQGERYRIWTAPVQTGDGEITRGLAVSQNITEQAERRRRLTRQNERLEEFASIVSHDLRNPLTVARTRLELARDTCTDDDLLRAIEAIERSQTLIDDLLTLARDGQEVAEMEPVSLSELAEGSWETVDTGSATLELATTQVIEADRSRLQQLLENLYRNAVEHGSSPHSQARGDSVERGPTDSETQSDDGENVTVTVGTMADGFYVSDTGPGIPKAQREEVFEAGYSTNDEGTGFGLRIVEQVAEAHGWEVTVTESAGEGARFEVTGVQFPDR